MKRFILGCVGLTAFAVQATLRVTVGVGDELPLVKPSEAVARLKADIESDASAGTICFTVKNVLGGDVALVRDLAFNDGKASVAVLDAPISKGAYDVAWSCTADGETVVGSRRIAVCDDLGPSQGLDGEFLFGTHAHLQCCRTRHEEELEVRAAARAGFKVMRIDLAWRDMEQKRGVLDWSLGEWRVGLLQRYGILPQVLTGMAPDWAVKKDWVYERPERGPCGNKLPENELWREFLGKMAAHFGNRIPFYELYNEPDLVGFGNFSVNDYVASFNAGARGVHAGCPSAKVLTGGIACWRLTVDTKKDFLPRGVLDTTDNFDILAIHEHGVSFFKSLDENWLPLLKANGIRKPIWPNETSEDGLRGEAAQAACYMQKALFSWSRGCCAHNWYKVRDEFRDLPGTRCRFGLLSRDFEPLAAYPAVAGTITVYRDAHFVAEIPNEDMELLLFSKNGNLLLAGWPYKPNGAVPPRPVKIRTDATDVLFVDLMGNPRKVQFDGGIVTFDVGRYIGSLELRGATKAEAIANPPLPTPERMVIRVPDGDFTTKPQFVLDKPEQYTSLAGYNPATEHLMWRGPSDLNAKFWLRRDGDTLAIRAEVTDDIVRFSSTKAPKDGDSMAVAFKAGDKLSIEWVNSTDGHIYERSFSLSKLGFSPTEKILFNAQVWDCDEGDVAEGFIGISADLQGRNPDEWAELEMKGQQK